MPLHERDTIRDKLTDSVFARRDLTRPIPKYTFPRDATLPRDAFQLVSDELMLDGNARQNLATFCQTWAEPELLEPMALSVSKNMIDRHRPGRRHLRGRGQRLPGPALRPGRGVRLPAARVKSISASGHKFGLAPLGAGWVVWRDASELPDDLVFHVNYLGGDMPVFQINFSRPAGQIIASSTTSATRWPTSQAPGHRAHDQARSRRVQPPVAATAGKRGQRRDRDRGRDPAQPHQEAGRGSAASGLSWLMLTTCRAKSWNWSSSR